METFGAHTPYLSPALFPSLGELGTPPLLGRGLAPLHWVPQSSIGLFMWEVTTHFSTTSQAAGLNVTVLLRASRGHGTSSVLLSLWESHRSHHRSKGLDPGHRGALGISFCGLNKI